MALDFYHGHGSPYSWRVWLALELKGVPYNLKVLSFQNNDTKKPEFVALNPRHTVPTIVDDGYSLWESLAILEYLDERFTAGPKLYSGDARARAKSRASLTASRIRAGARAVICWLPSTRPSAGSGWRNEYPCGSNSTPDSSMCA